MNWSVLFPVIFAVALYFTPHPCAINPKGWVLLSIFSGTIVASITKPFPMGPVSLAGLILCVFFGCFSFQDALSGFSLPLIWMIVFVFLISKSFSCTHLGERIAFFFIRLCGKKTVGIGYGLAFAELLIAPLVPSSGARSGGIFFPIVSSISKALGSAAEKKTSQTIGAFLTQVSFQANGITSAMFLTAMAANPLIQSIAQKQNVAITWGKWALAASVPGLISLLVMPFALYIISPPSVKQFPQAIDYASHRLKEIGRVTRKEKIIICVFLMMLGMWIFGSTLTIDPVCAALLGLLILIFTRVLKWNELLAENEAWHTLIWMSCLVTMATYLQKYGVIDALSSLIGQSIQGTSHAFLILVLTYFYSHYFFASNTSHASAMYAAFLSVGILVGLNPLKTALVLGFCTSLFGGLTHYSSSPAPIWFGAGYVSLKRWWINGFLVSVVNLSIWLGVGFFWWRFLKIF